MPLRFVAALLVLGGLALGGCADRLPDTPAELLAYAEAHPERASVAVVDLASGAPVRALAADAERAAAGLPALWLAWAVAADSAALPARVPAAAVKRVRVPGVGPPAADSAALAPGDLVRAALRGDPAAADALVDALGRARVDALGRAGFEGPLPVGGLHLAWAPLGRDGTPADRAAAFRRLPPAARRDSAYARARAFATSPSVRAEEAARWERGHLGLADDDLVATARATFPQATAAAVARWLADAARGDHGVPPDALLGLLPPGADVPGVRAAAGAGPGIASAAAVGRTRAAAVLLDGLAAADVRRLAPLAQALAERLADGQDLGAPDPGARP